MASAAAVAASARALACRTPQWGAVHPHAGAAADGAGGASAGGFAALSLYNTAARRRVAPAAGSPAAAGAVGVAFREGWRGAVPRAVAVGGGAAVAVVGFALDVGCAAAAAGCYLCRFHATGPGGAAPPPMHGGRVPCADRCVLATGGEGRGGGCSERAQA
jgi:hypothetical protein